MTHSHDIMAEPSRKRFKMAQVLEKLLNDSTDDSFSEVDSD